MLKKGIGGFLMQTVSCEFEKDRDLKFNVWQHYMKKYSDHYLLNRDELGIWQIRLKENLGHIQPFSIVNKKLVAILDFNTKNKKTFFIKRTHDFEVRINQEGEQDLCIVFDEKNIKQCEKLFKIRKRYKISKKEIQKRIQRIEKAREIKNSKNFEVF